ENSTRLVPYSGSRPPGRRSVPRLKRESASKRRRGEAPEAALGREKRKIDLPGSTRSVGLPRGNRPKTSGSRHTRTGPRRRPASNPVGRTPNRPSAIRAVFGAGAWDRSTPLAQQAEDGTIRRRTRRSRFGFLPAARRAEPSEIEA